MNIHLKIKECINKKGAGIIVTKTLIGMLDDERVFEDIETTPYKKILRNIISEGYAQKLLDLGGYTSDVSFLASQYAQANLMHDEPVLYIFDCLAYGLGWTKKEPTLLVSPPQENEQSQVKNTSRANEKKECDPTTEVEPIEIPYWMMKTSSHSMLFSRIKDLLKEDFRWFGDNYERIFSACFSFCLVLFLVSLVAIGWGWYNDFGHAPIWTWLFWESLVIGIISFILILVESR